MWCAMGSTPTCGIRSRTRGAKQAPRTRGARKKKSRHWENRYSSSWASTSRSRSSRSSAGSRGRKAWHTWLRPHTGSPPRCSWCCAPARLTPPRSPPRSPRLCRTCRAPAVACSGYERCCRSARFAKYSQRQRFSCARRCTSRWGSSISRQWPARRPWSPPTWVAFQKWWPTGTPGSWCTTTRVTRQVSRRGWPTPSTRSSQIRTEPNASAGRAVNGASTSFRGRSIAQQTLEIYRKVSAS